MGEQAIKYKVLPGEGKKEKRKIDDANTRIRLQEALKDAIVEKKEKISPAETQERKTIDIDDINRGLDLSDARALLKRKEEELVSLNKRINGDEEPKKTPLTNKQKEMFNDRAVILLGEIQELEQKIQSIEK